jgi:TonB family protein
MMRKAIVAALVLSPLMVHRAASAEDRATAKPGTVRISTGVVAPKIVHTVSVQSDLTSVKQLASNDTKVVVDMIVDESGKPTALKVSESPDKSIDQSVLAAVSQFRFQAGTVSGQATAFPVKLVVDIQHIAQ